MYRRTLKKYFGIMRFICDIEILSLETRNASASSHKRKNINILYGEIIPSTKIKVFSIGHISTWPIQRLSKQEAQ